MAEGGRRKKKYEFFNQGQGIDLSNPGAPPTPLDHSRYDHSSPPLLDHMSLSPGPSTISPLAFSPPFQHFPRPSVQRVPALYQPYDHGLPEPHAHSSRYYDPYQLNSVARSNSPEVHSLDNSYVPPTGTQRKKRKQTCQKCRNHGLESLVKEHKWTCPYRECDCEKCETTESKKEVMRQQKKQSRPMDPHTMLAMHSPASIDNDEVDFPQLRELERETADIPNIELCRKIDRACKSNQL